MKLTSQTPAGSLIALATASALAGGCIASAEEPTETEEIVDNLRQAGFPAADIMVVDGAVFVGRDAEVSLAASREMLQTGDTSQEQYRTSNLVGSSITKICVDGSAYTGVFSTALDLAIENYASLPLSFTMARTPATGCSYTITATIHPTMVGGQAGFPSGGLPYYTFTVGSPLSAYGADVIEHVITHELGHTIGFRHTDYFNRSISCGSGGDEGSAGVGAIHISGTPTGASVGGSIMNSCFRSSENGELASSDITALHALYPAASLAFRTSSNHYLVAENGGGAQVAANRTAVGIWERFAYTDVNGGSLVSGDVINLRAYSGAYVVAEGSGGGVVNANRSAAGPWEAFRIYNLDGGSTFSTGTRVALQAANGQYVVAENGGGGGGSGSVNANRSAVGAWETFVLSMY